MPDEDAQDHSDAELAALRQRLDEANQRLLHAELKAHAIRAGILDLDGLKLLDTSRLILGEDGTVTDAEQSVAGLKRDKPWLFGKSAPALNSSHPATAPQAELPKARKATDMSFDEWQAARARLLRGH
jgi:hypothetical protein